MKEEDRNWKQQKKVGRKEEAAAGKRRKRMAEDATQARLFSRIKTYPKQFRTILNSTGQS